MFICRVEHRFIQHDTRISVQCGATLRILKPMIKWQKEMGIARVIKSRMKLEMRTQFSSASVKRIVSLKYQVVDRSKLLNLILDWMRIPAIRPMNFIMST